MKFEDYFKQENYEIDEEAEELRQRVKAEQQDLEVKQYSIINNKNKYIF